MIAVISSAVVIKFKNLNLNVGNALMRFTMPFNLIHNSIAIALFLKVQGKNQ